MTKQPPIRTEVMPISKIVTENHSGLMIPSIQRDYKWGPGHDADDSLNSAAYVFLEDMIDFYRLRSEDDVYFTGTMIVFEEEGQERTQVMDGQQRWTTVTALMGVIRHLLSRNKLADHSEVVAKIEHTFLSLRDGEPLLLSKKKTDQKSIKFLIDLEPHQSVKTAPKARKNTFQFKRDNIRYDGTSINCVMEYFQDRLSKEFGIKGQNSNLTKLVDFYEVISSYVYINYSHTDSPSLAYKMFVTANSRGTPLNNFDVFRGLVMANNRINNYGEEKELQWILDEADEILQDLFNKSKDIGKAIDKVMSDAVTVLQGEKVSTNHVMSRLEHRISKFSSRKELDDLAEFFAAYFQELQLIENQRGKMGRTQNLRMRYYGFTQQIQYYAAARVTWGRKSPPIERLMNTLEIIITRKLILADGRISALFYQLAPKHFKLIRECKTEEEQETVVQKIAKQFEMAKENPTDGEIEAILLKHQFSVENTNDKCKLIAILTSIEDNKYRDWQFSSKMRNPKVVRFMPKYEGVEHDFSYPKSWMEKDQCPNYLGNHFLIKESLTNKDLEKFKPIKGKRSTQINSNGNMFAASYYQTLLGSAWNMSMINARTKILTKKLLKRFPTNCMM
tara:strand:- start:613 stop:2466 length:1854 start_codon:yes stop_codon:yes gene_type:complete